MDVVYDVTVLLWNWARCLHATKTKERQHTINHCWSALASGDTRLMEMTGTAARVDDCMVAEFSEQRKYRIGCVYGVWFARGYESITLLSNICNSVLIADLVIGGGLAHLSLSAALRWQHVGKSVDWMFKVNPLVMDNQYANVVSNVINVKCIFIGEIWKL